ncbi:hypothetical protein Mgra_00002069 [Meloidogyne graminicola]|uniref:Uncharacterized protein n=1 Tax=Meloidogyne graminicola TaxID=189291 RepID=A0A8S9ZZF5_9BILA|nr:hypothetical protein Mgra_00002069 [Meloidogyne graminicola]
MKIFKLFIYLFILFILINIIKSKLWKLKEYYKIRNKRHCGGI